MSLPSTDKAYRRILANKRNSTKLRLAALRAMSQVGIPFLAELEADESTPDKLRFAVAQRREVEMALRKRMKNEPRNPGSDS